MTISLIWLLTILTGMKKKDNGLFHNLVIKKDLFLCQNSPQTKISMRKRKRKKLFLGIPSEIHMEEVKMGSKWIKSWRTREKVMIASTCLQGLRTLLTGLNYPPWRTTRLKGSSLSTTNWQKIVERKMKSSVQ